MRGLFNCRGESDSEPLGGTGAFQLTIHQSSNGQRYWKTHCPCALKRLEIAEFPRDSVIAQAGFVLLQ